MDEELSIDQLIEQNSRELERVKYHLDRANPGSPSQHHGIAWVESLEAEQRRLIAIAESAPARKPPAAGAAFSWDEIAAQLNAEAAATRLGFMLPAQASHPLTRPAKRTASPGRGDFLSKAESVVSWDEITAQLNAEAKAGNPAFLIPYR